MPAPQILTQEKLSSLLTDNSPFSKFMPGFKTRGQQITMAAQVNAALLNNTKLIAEAGTGTGKSLAYLLPAAHYAINLNKKIIVATCTKALQNQLIKKDLPVINKYFNGALNYYSLMGSENYLCLRRLNAAIGDGPDIFDDKAVFNTLPELEKTAVQASTGLKSEIADHITPSIWDKVKRESDLCFKRKCPYYEQCLYKKDVKAANQAHILVVNHHVYFSYLPVENYDGVIFDEAHNIEDTAAIYFGFSVSNKLITRLVRELHAGGQSIHKKIEKKHPDFAQELTQLCGKALNESEQFFYLISQKAGFKPGVYDKTSENGVRVITPNIVTDTLSAPLVKISSVLSIVAQTTKSDDLQILAQSYCNRFLACAKAVKAFLELKENDACFWCRAKMIRGKPYVEINMTPLNIAEKLKEEVFSKDMPFILTSATLAVSGKFDTFTAGIGFTNYKELLLDSPFDYENNVLLYTMDAAIPDPGALPEEFNKGSLKAMAQIINTWKYGGIFVLCTSHAYLELAREMCRNNNNFDRKVFFQGDDNPHILLNSFREAKNGILFGSDTFWQGVDVSGKELSCVIISRLPFASPADPVESARNQYLSSKGINPFTEHTLPKAVIQFHQGFGRLIRRDTDKGLVAVLDPRINTRSYGIKFISSIPKCKYTQSLDEVSSFLFRVSKNDNININEK